MTSLENNGQDMDLTELEVMEPKMMIHDELKVIYINEALEEALNDENSNEKKKYDAEKAAHPDYVTRLRRLPVTIEFMKKYAALKKDSFMQDLIERKEPALRAEGELYEVYSFFALKNMFLARYPDCRNIYKVEKKIKEFEERQRTKE